MSRAIDDPAKLARAAKIVRGALERKHEAERLVEEKIRAAVDEAPPLPEDFVLRARQLVAGWPPFSEETRSSLRGLLRPVKPKVSTEESIRRIVAAAPPLTAEQTEKLQALLPPPSMSEPAARRTAKSPDRRARKHPADVAAEKINEMIERQKREHAAIADVREVRRIVELTGQTFSDALANWRAIEAARRYFARRDAGDVDD